MKYTCAAIFLALGIFLTGIFTGCASPPPPPPSPTARQTLPPREALPAPPPPPEFPIRPVTRDLLDLIGKSAYKLGDLQYFISSAITVERSKGMQYDIELKDGEGRIQEINTVEKIIIPKNTGGVLIQGPSTGSSALRLLKICFDDMEEHTLTFRENPSDKRFYLVFREDRNYGEFIEYGNEICKVDFNGEIPYLYVRLEEIIDTQPRTRELAGRFVQSR
ncbi:hypothetical protein AGMMS49940_12450 [Spirochaetia bacterium]|nr:hypothetical protein AGMMS49940_12450 [Spirochaetia bacterium]